MYFAIDEESEFHQRLNPVAMAKRQIPNGYKNTTKSLTDRIKTKPVSESEDYIDIDEEYLFDEDTGLVLILSVKLLVVFLYPLGI